MNEADRGRAVEAAADAIAGAENLVFCAGAGMGVDSGLPDFRGDSGFWRAYPPLRSLGISFHQMANPAWFRRDPELAWGFYGHRLHLYRATRPHGGFATLLRLANERESFVFTSNVDGHFQQAGFPDDRVFECHGSLMHLQCVRPCNELIYPADETTVAVDETTFRASAPLPACPACGELARPALLMFNDGAWVSRRSDVQSAAFSTWLDSRDLRGTAVIECGAGSAVPTVRRCSESLARAGATLIRINPRESQGPEGTISLPMGAADALFAIERRLTGVG